MSWKRLEPPVTPGPLCSGSQIGMAYDARWTTDLGPDGVAVVTRSYYRAQDGGPEYLECQTEYLLCGDLSDPHGSSTVAAYTYTNVGPVDATEECVTAAYNAPDPSDEEFLAGILTTAKAA